MPLLHPCWVDELIDVKKYPMAFRNAPTNQQIGGAANHYVVDVLKLKKVAVISDTTGYGTASVNTYVPMLKAKGAEVVYQGNVDAANPDLKPEMLRMQSAGAQAIMPWSVNAGFLSRILNTRGADGLGRADRRPDDARLRPDQGAAGEARVLEQGLLRTTSATSATSRRQAAAARQEFVDRLRRPRSRWATRCCGGSRSATTAPRLMAETFKAAGTEPDEIVGYLNKVKGWPGVYGNITWTPEQHNGFPDDEVVMCEVNSLKDGAFNLAPGYSA